MTRRSSLFLQTPASRLQPGSRLALAFLLLAALAVRLPGVARPLLGDFATKNAVYGMIARNFALGRAPAWRPTVDCLAGGERGLHLLEVPVTAYLAGGLWRCCGGSLDVWGRLTSIACSVAAVWLTYLLVRRRQGETVALAAGAVLAFAPVSIIYGQSFMLEASLVCFALAALVCFDLWLEALKLRWLTLFTISFALLLLTKVYMAVLLLPLGWMLVRATAEVRRMRRLARAIEHDAGIKRTDGPGDPSYKLWCGSGLAILLAFAPATAWVWYVGAITAPGSPWAQRVFYSLRDSAGVHGWPHPLLTSADFYRSLLDNLAGVALTPIGAALVLLGFTDAGWKRWLPWLLGMGLLVVALPLKFHQMNYYYLVILPPLAILAGQGWGTLHARLRPTRAVSIGLALAFLVFAARYAARPAFVTPPEDAAVIAAAEAARVRLAADEPIATLHGTTLDLLYYCDRPGWALSVNDARLGERLVQCRAAGARFLIVAGWNSLPRETRDVLAALPSVEQGDGYRMLWLP